MPKGGRDLLVCCSLAPTVGVTWPRQSGISGPRSTAPAEVRGGTSFCSTAAAGSSAGALSGSTVRADAGDTLFASAAAAAGCISFRTVGGLSGSTVISGAAGILFGSTAEAAGCASFHLVRAEQLRRWNPNSRACSCTAKIKERRASMAAICSQRSPHPHSR
jgi:hypothetical protein